MRHLWLGMLVSIGLAACGGNDLRDGYDTAALEAPTPQAVMMRSEAEVAGASSGPAPQGDPVANEGGEQFIAYTHSLSFSLPREGVEPVMLAHIAACEAAGPRKCIIINSSLNNQSDDYANGYLSMRAEPNWIDGFLNGVDEEVSAADGEITSRNKQAVDLTRAILDTDARLNAQIILKGRLEDLLANRDGELSELLQVERELARVTGDIESITSNLKALRLRVSMSELTMQYATKRSLVGGGRANPLSSAFGDFFYNMSSALAGVITFFAVGLPWMVLIGIFLFIWLRLIWPWVRKRRTGS
ncbi:MAG: DUF4349 domain-containing protein [Hyphomonadaceae bacterium]